MQLKELKERFGEAPRTLQPCWRRFSDSPEGQRAKGKFKLSFSSFRELVSFGLISSLLDTFQAWRVPSLHYIKTTSFKHFFLKPLKKLKAKDFFKKFCTAESSFFFFKYITAEKFI